MVDYAQLEEEIKKIIELVEKLPEPYRATSFEVLLNAAMRGAGLQPTTSGEDATVPKEQTTIKLDLPIDVRAFLVQYSIPDEAINKLFLIHGKDIRPIYKITETKYSTAQMQIAFLAALENALKGPDSKFEFSYDKVRALCRHYNKLDTGNFTQNFRVNKKYFGSLADEDHVPLSPEGKDALADLVADLINAQN